MNKTAIKSNLDEYERLFLSLGDKTRLRLLSLMAVEPVSVGFLVDELGESQPKVSRHLAYLRNSGVVNTRRDGKWIYYGIQQSDDPDVNRVIRLVIDTLLGVAADEPTDNKRSNDNKTHAEETAGKADKANVDSVHHKREDETPELELEEAEFVNQIADEGASVEREIERNELDVFLL